VRVRTQCRECGLPFSAVIRRPTPESPAEPLVCPNCSDAREVAAEGWTDRAPAGAAGSVERCPICGSKHLYRQRDFNRALGCLLVAIGAALVPWTYGLSLIVLSAVDFLLYRRLQYSPVCYRCDTVFRDARPTRRQGEFDLLKHDVLKYGKSWEDDKR
jgi:DNA-directed RNA polymerase subunit RPC12/RpoP